MNTRRMFLQLIGMAPAGGVAIAATKPATKLNFPKIQTVWLGDTIDTLPDPDSLMRSQRLLTYDQDSHRLGFFYGHQWDPEIQQNRVATGRPCLVINKLPSLLAAVLAKSAREIHESEIRQLKIAIADRNLDAQRAFNYMASATVEEAQLNVHPMYMVKGK